jgi:pimeloyl-ACP methyl ester carboxylesterase
VERTITATDLRSETFTEPSLDGVRLHTLRIDRPGAPTLVLLHGGGANAHWWDHLAPALARDFRVIALDFRGHGDSDHPQERASGAFDRDLDALLSHLDAPDAVLMGHSMGAHVALRAAARRSGLRGVVAVEASRGGERGEGRRARLALAARRTYPSHADAVRRFQFLPATPNASDRLRRAIAGHSVRQESDGRFGYKFDPAWFAFGRGELPQLEHVSCPVLIVRGDRSPLLSEAGAAEWLAGLSDARAVVIAGAGHNPHIERPDEFLAAVEPFLASLREAVGTNSRPAG